MNDSFVFYRSFADALAELPAEQYKQIMLAITCYALDGSVPEFDDPMVKAIFTLIKPQIDANNKRREAGRKGGETTPKQTEATPKQTEATPKQTEANVNVNANANDILTPFIPLSGEEATKAPVSDPVPAAAADLTEEVRDKLMEFHAHLEQLSHHTITISRVDAEARKLISITADPAKQLELIELAIKNNWWHINEPFKREAPPGNAEKEAKKGMQREGRDLDTWLNAQVRDGIGIGGRA